MDILETIVTQRRKDVEISKETVPEESLYQRMTTTYPNIPLNLYRVLTSSLLEPITNIPETFSNGDNSSSSILSAIPMIVAAEFKRASPSKGNLIAVDTVIDQHALSYTIGGAHIISILTEPTWFKGSLQDMENSRRISEAQSNQIGRIQRPIILRKEFIMDRYQILEARAYGADTVLLIVSVLSTVDTLQPLITYSRSLGMEPLVEVNSVNELDIAIQAGSLCIGINNRNLRTFTVDLTTTSRIVHYASAYYRQQCQNKDNTANSSQSIQPLAILSLSGIRSTEDIQQLITDCITADIRSTASTNTSTTDSLTIPSLVDQKGGNNNVPIELRIMRGFLIGEALMRSNNPQEMVHTLVTTGQRIASQYLLSSSSTTVSSIDNNNGSKKNTVESNQYSKPTNSPMIPLQHRIPINISLLVKICGIKEIPIALLAAQTGTDLLGSIMVPNSPRTLTIEMAKELNVQIKKFREQDPSPLLTQLKDLSLRNTSTNWSHRSKLLNQKYSILRDAIRRARPLTVGVFMDEVATEVIEKATGTDFDIIQLHGNEKPQDYRTSTKPIIKVFHIPLPFPKDDDNTPSSKYTGKSKAQEIIIDLVDRIEEWSDTASILLIDSKASPSSSLTLVSNTSSTNSGGTGMIFDHTQVFQSIDTEITERYEHEQSSSSSISVPLLSTNSTITDRSTKEQRLTIPFMLAGGLTASLVTDIIQKLKNDTLTDHYSSVCYIGGMDVSSGVEYTPDTILDTVTGIPVGKGKKNPAEMMAFIANVKK